MMKKKVTSLLLAAALAVSMSIPAFAEGSTATITKGPKTTKVTTKIDVKYTVTIPETLNITANTENTDLNIEVSDALLNPQGKVVVTATAAGKMTNTSGSGSTLAYKLKNGAADFTQFEFTADGTKTCQVNITPEAWAAAAAGDYSGETTFNISYDDGKSVQQ